MAKDDDANVTAGQSRRTFMKTAAAATGLYWLGPTLMFKGEAVAAIPGNSLNPDDVDQFVQPLVIPPVMPPTNENLVDERSRNVCSYYEIAVRQFQQQILPPSEPKTTVWSYCSILDRRPVVEGGTLNYPALTIETTSMKPVRIKWINELVAGPEGKGDFLPHLLAVDPTLHWANPPRPRNSRPTFTSTPGPYTGPVPIVTHVHGAVGVGDESDGYAEAWFLPDADNIKDFATEGTWYNFFKEKANAKFGVKWGRGFAVFQYPNDQRATTIWYHDHALGMTRLNVYAGPAGFYLVRGGPDDESVKGFRAPQLDDPAGIGYTEIPIAIQDRSFKSDGSLFYPDNRAFFDGYDGPFIPDFAVSPIWNPEFFGDTIVVNGRTWPFLEVEPRRYRFRLLNGCDSRFLILKLSNKNLQFGVIGNEGGLLPAPVLVRQLLMAPAERYDVIVDFTGLSPGTTFRLLNIGPDSPFGGLPVPPADQADPATTGRVMEFRVVEPKEKDLSKPVDELNLPPIENLTGGTTRRLALLEEAVADVVEAVLLGVVEGDTAAGRGVARKKLWADPITENPAVGATEVWEIYNLTVDAHPIHIHEIQFQLVDRQPITFTPGKEPTSIQVVGKPNPPAAIERGYKDTFIAYPSHVTRVRLMFKTPGNFVWHCHIVEHEDNEMMRPYRIGQIQPGSPE